MAEMTFEENDIVCGDCLEIMAGMPDGCVDLVVTSPPYNLGIDYGKYKDDLSWSEYYAWCKVWLQELYRIMKDDGRLCLNHYLSFGTSKFRTAPLMELNHIAVHEVGLRHHSIAIWPDKTLVKHSAWGSWLSASAPYINSPYEGILFLFKQSWKKLRSGSTEIGKDEFIESCRGTWKMPPARGKGVASFPIELPARCIRLLSYKDDFIFDPFMGHGTTAVAADRLGRRWFGCDTSGEYVAMALERVAQDRLKRSQMEMAM